MKKITLKINKIYCLLATILCSGAALAQECPENIAVNNTAGTCGSVVTYTAPEGTDAFTENGVVNPDAADGLTGWNVVNGGSGWLAHPSGFFIASHQNGSMNQVIDLTTMNLTDAYMDTQPAITVSEDYIGWGVNYADPYSFTVELRGEANNVIATYTTGNTTTSATMQTATHTFTNYGTGVRKVYISHSGRDAEGWAGQYGAAITNVQCKVALPAVTVTQTAGLASGEVFPIGTTTNTFEINNAAENTTTTCSFDVVVTDNEAPVIVTVPEITVELDAEGTATITAEDIDNGTTDNCTNSPLALSLSATTFTCENLGNNTVTLSATDGTNTATKTAIVKVVDNTAPVLSVHNATIALGANGIATLTAADVDNGSTDNCSLTLSFNQTNFSCMYIGPNNIIVTAKDPSGNTVTAPVTVTVTDNTAPVAIAQNITVALGQDGTVTVDPWDVNNGSTDNCTIATASLNTAIFNCTNLGENTVILTVADALGNQSMATAVITVTDTEGYCTASATAFEKAFAVYPNPTSGLLNIETTSYQIDTVEIFDMNARLLKTFSPESGSFSADLSAFNAGMYFVKIHSGSNVATKKIIKQ